MLGTILSIIMIQCIVGIYMYVCIIYIIKNVNHTIVTYYILINIINSIINDTNNT